MIRHVFKLMWNRKRRNFLLTVEIFFSFLVLFAVATMAISNFIKYLQPLGFSYGNVWMVDLNVGSDAEGTSKAEIRETLAQLEQELRSYNEIESFAWAAGNVPYTGSTWSTGFTYEGQKIGAEISLADDNFSTVMGIPILEGRWFNREDDASTMTPIVVTSSMREQMKGDDPIVGLTHAEKDEEYVIVGVVPDYHHLGEFNDARAGFFERNLPQDSASHIPEVALLLMRSGTGVQFEETLTKRLSAIAKDWPLRIETMKDKRAAHIKETLTGLVTFTIVAGFLIFNVALGLYGVLWYSISRRRGEIGLRRAIGASTGKVSKQILAESMAMTTFAIIVGMFFALQAPILGLGIEISTMVYLFAMAGAAGSIYLLVTVCALYPSMLAARIKLATAQNEE